MLPKPRHVLKFNITQYNNTVSIMGVVSNQIINRKYVLLVSLSLRSKEDKADNMFEVWLKIKKKTGAFSYSVINYLGQA